MNRAEMKLERMARRAAATLIVALGVGYALWSFPASREDTHRLLDFSEFYAAGQIVRQGLGSQLYDLKTQAEFQLQSAPVHAFYLRPPFEALLFVPFAFLTYRAAYAAWVLISVALLAAVAWMLAKNTNVLAAMLQYTRGIPADTGLLMVVMLTFEPTMNCILIGQDSMLLLLVYTLVFLSLKRGGEAKAGAWLACGLFKFHLVLPFVVILALRRRWRFVLGFACVALLLVGVSVLVSGTGVLAAYPKMFFDSRARSLMSFQPEYAANVRGLVYLAAGGRISATVSAAIVAAISAALLWITARSWPDLHNHQPNGRQFELGFSAAVVATLLTGFHAFIYDLSLLLLPVAITIGALAKRNALLRNLPLNAALIVLFIPPLHHFLIVEHVYAVMGLAVIGLFVGIVRQEAGVMGTRPALSP